MTEYLHKHLGILCSLVPNLKGNTREMECWALIIDYGFQIVSNQNFWLENDHLFTVTFQTQV